MELRNGSLVGGSPGKLPLQLRPAFEEGVRIILHRYHSPAAFSQTSVAHLGALQCSCLKLWRPIGFHLRAYLKRLNHNNVAPGLVWAPPITLVMGSRWTALCLAVENEWGGRDSRQKADQMYQDILAWFYDNKGIKISFSTNPILALHHYFAHETKMQSTAFHLRSTLDKETFCAKIIIRREL